MHDAATEETVAEWWERWPDANVGVITGSLSDVVVVDVDPRNGGDATLQAIEDRRGPLPATTVARTGGGGLFDPVMIDARTQILLHEHPASPGSTAESFPAMAGHLPLLDTVDGCQDIPRRLVDVVVTTEIT